MYANDNPTRMGIHNASPRSRVLDRQDRDMPCIRIILSAHGSRLGIIQRCAMHLDSMDRSPSARGAIRTDLAITVVD
jgi:cellulose synthase/poly-beta-1,6-N-acetylglucosamine synthase-like glycosyltransferase